MSEEGADTSAQDVVVFDLDGVLTRRDTLTALLVTAARRRPWRLFMLLGALWTVVRHGHDFSRRARAVGRVVAVVLSGVDGDDLDRWCDSVGRRAASGAAWVLPELVEEYRRLQDEGCSIVVATATEQRVALALLASHDLRPTAVLASRITLTAGSARLAFYNYGPQKAESLHASGVAVEQAVFYTDSRSDLPTARAAARTVLVRPRPGTVQAYRAAGVDCMVFAMPSRP